MDNIPVLSGELEFSNNYDGSTLSSYILSKNSIDTIDKITKKPKNIPKRFFLKIPVTKQSDDKE